VATAKLFRNGRSQAVRLPKAFRFEGEEVSIRREGDSVILEPLKIRRWPRGYWRSWGKASRNLEAPEPLPYGGSPIDMDDR
jgi:antitoxin VapB